MWKLNFRKAGQFSTWYLIRFGCTFFGFFFVSMSFYKTEDSWISIDLNFFYLSCLVFRCVYSYSYCLFLLCFYNSYDVNLWEEKLTNVFVEFHHFTEAATGGVLQKRCSYKFCNIHRKTVMLESLCGPSSLQFYQKETSTLMFSCEYCEIFNNTYFEEHLRTTASYFMKKNRHSWRLSNSSKKNLNRWKSMNLQFCKMTCLQRKSKENASKSNQIPGGNLI